MKYRPEIDGLRAFAILPVLLYHAGFEWMPGGWLGVDVFFVISGFLITGILFRDLEAGEFSLSRFYERRARRILPALTLVVLATILVAPFFMWPWQIEELGRSVVATNTFVANVFFEAKVDYFRNDAEEYPLIHMWSLAIEEQYYVVLPLLMAALWRIGFRAGKIFTIISVISILSIFAAYVMAERYPSQTFYLLQYRAYELGIGSLAAIMASRGWIFQQAAARGATVIGLTLLFYSIAMVDSTGGDPIMRLPPVIGTAMILLSNLSAGFVRSIFVNPVARYIGLISFSLYLWHQPMFAYAKLYTSNIDWAFTASLLIACTIISTLSWRYIEQPMRRGSHEKRRVLIVAVCTLVIVSILGAVLNSQANRVASVSHIDADLAVRPAVRASYVRDGYNKVAGRNFTNSEELTNVLLLGDSFSQDLYNMLTENNIPENVEVRTFYSKAKCQPYFGSEDVSKYVPYGYKDYCAKRSLHTPPAQLVKDADLIILAANWRPWMIERIHHSLNWLGYPDGKKILILGSKMFGPDERANLKQFKGLNNRQRSSYLSKVGSEFHEGYIMQKENIPKEIYLDIQGQICSEGGKICPLFTPGGKLISHDYGHLTKSGASYVGSVILNDPRLATFTHQTEVESKKLP